MNTTKLFKLAWEYAAMGAAKYGGTKSQYFRSALEQVTDMYKEGKDEEDIRDEIDPRRVLVAREDLPVIPYDKFQSGGVLHKYTEGGEFYSFWYLNHGTGPAAGKDDVALQDYAIFQNSEVWTVEQFLTDANVLSIVRTHLHDQSIRWVPEVNTYVYGDRFDKLNARNWEDFPDPDEDELAAMHEYDEEQRLKRAMKEARDIFGDDLYD